MRVLADAVILSTGLRWAGTAWGAGAAGALAMAPFDFAPALVATMTVAVLLLDGAAAEGAPLSRARLAAAASVGWWLGFGYFTAGLWWLGNAFLVEADQFAWALPLGVLGLPAVLAFFTAAGFAASAAVWSSGAGRILALAAGLAGSEYLRSVLFTGFPWNAFGMALAAVPGADQSAALFGLHGLTLIAVALAAAPAMLLVGVGRRERLLAPALAAGVLLLLAGGGALRLAFASDDVAPGIRFRILQPGVPQDAKFHAANGPAILQRYLTSSAGNGDPVRPAMQGITHLVWPESAFPFILGREPAALGHIAAFLRPSGAVLITGAVRESRGIAGEGERLFYNSIQVVDPTGAIVAGADKVHLVPFGEYLPFEALLTRLGLRRFVHAPGSFGAGEVRTALPVPGLSGVSPLVCYEAIFPGAVTPFSAAVRPRLLLNVTNDAWFGDTPGPRQHFAQARLRSIEEGLPLVRSANTGVSAVVDGYGRIRARMDVGEVGFIDAELPEPLGLTVFGRLGQSLFAGIWLIIALTAIVLSRRRA